MSLELKSVSDPFLPRKPAGKGVAISSKVIPNPKARLLDQVREVLRVKHYAIRTEEVYVLWIKRFIFFHQKLMPTTSGSI